MEIPNSQFHLFWVEHKISDRFSDTSTFFIQTFEEALHEACGMAKSDEFIDLDPDNSLRVKLYFPKTKANVTIHSKLFTYNPQLPLAVPNCNGHDKIKKYEFRNLNV